MRRLGIIRLLSRDEAVMVDKGSLVDDLVLGKGHRPVSPSKGNQMSALDVAVTQYSARLRVHVDRFIRSVVGP